MLDTDVIVGAPFEDEGHGAAYVYHGCETGLVDQYAQKLSPALLRLPALRGFAHSFASRMDIDNNRYPGRAVPIDFLLLSSNSIRRQCLCCYHGRAIARVHPVHFMNAEQHQVAADLWTKP